MTTTATTSDSNKEGNTMPTDTQDVTVDDLARLAAELNGAPIHRLSGTYDHRATIRGVEHPVAVGDDDRLMLDRRFRDASLSTPAANEGWPLP